MPRTGEVNNRRAGSGQRTRAEPAGFQVTRLSRGRLMVLDLVKFASRQPTMHGLIEVDITGVRDRLTAVGASVTAFVAGTVGRAVEEFPQFNVRRAGRRIVSFDRVRIVVTLEGEMDGAPIPFVLDDAADKRPDEITFELRSASEGTEGEGRDYARQSLLGRLPSGLRRIGALLLSRIPRVAARFGPPVGVSSLGMFGAGWGIPLSPMTLMVTVGGIAERPVLDRGLMENHEFLPLTLSFDHSVVDGAPAARFATRLRSLLESGAALDGWESHGDEVGSLGMTTVHTDHE